VPIGEGGQIILSVQEYTGSNVTYEWFRFSNPQNNVGNELTIDAISVAEIGEYSVVVTVDGCVATSDIIDVVFFERPRANIASVTPLTCVTGNEDVDLTALPTDGFMPYNYLWSGPNDFVSADSIATILNVTSGSSGNYTLQITDANGCVSEIASTEVDITEDGSPIENINNELIISPVTTTNIGEYSVMVTVDGCSANSDTIQVEVFVDQY